MDFLRAIGIEIPESKEDEVKKIELTEKFSLYSDYPSYIFKHNGENKGWLLSKTEGHAFLLEYATKYEKELCNKNVLITKEISNDKNIIKIFSKSLGTLYDGSPELLVTLEIEKLDQIE